MKKNRLVIFSFVFILSLQLILSERFDINDNSALIITREIGTEGAEYGIITDKGDVLELKTTDNNAKIVYWKKIDSGWKNQWLFENIKVNSRFVFDKKENKLIEAHFSVAQEGEYEIENLRFFVPENGKVDYENGKIVVTVPEESRIKKPSLIDTTNKEAGVDITYKVEGQKGVNLDYNGENIPLRGAPKTLNRDEFNTLEIGYDSKLDRFFLKNGEINNIAFGSISSEDRVYMFIGEEVPANFNEDFFKVDFTNKKVEIGAKAGSEGVYVNFYPGNAVISVDENQILSTKAIGHYNPSDEEKKNYGWNEWSDKSRVIIEDRGKDVIPLITTQGAFEVISGKQLVWYDKNSKVPLASPNYVKTGKNSVGVGIQSFDSEGKPIKYTIKENNVDKTLTYDGSTFINENGDIYSAAKNSNVYDRAVVNNLNNEYREKLNELISYDKQKALQIVSLPIEKIRYELDNLVPDFSKFFGSEKSARTKNFIVNSPNGNARAYATALEYWRKQHALEWLGKEIPDWDRPFPVTITSGPNIGGGGATTFSPLGRGRGIIPKNMNIQGSRDSLLYGTIPHETLHTVFASHFGVPIPRWIDEGACTAIECASERNKHNRLLVGVLQSDQIIPFNQMMLAEDYPRDVLTFYAQGASSSEFLLRKGGDGINGKRKLLQFLNSAISGGETKDAWTRALQKYYNINSINEFQNQWLRDTRQRIKTGDFYKK